MAKSNDRLFNKEIKKPKGKHARKRETVSELLTGMTPDELAGAQQDMKQEAAKRRRAVARQEGVRK